MQRRQGGWAARHEGGQAGRQSLRGLPATGCLSFSEGLPVTLNELKLSGVFESSWERKMTRLSNPCLGWDGLTGLAFPSWAGRGEAHTWSGPS